MGSVRPPPPRRSISEAPLVAAGQRELYSMPCESFVQRWKLIETSQNEPPQGIHWRGFSIGVFHVLGNDKGLGCHYQSLRINWQPIEHSAPIESLFALLCN